MTGKKTGSIIILESTDLISLTDSHRLPYSDFLPVLLHCLGTINAKSALPNPLR